MLLLSSLIVLVGEIRKRSEFELVSVSMLKTVNKLQHVEARLHFIASKFPLTPVGMHYKSNQLTYIIRMAIAFQEVR